MKYIHRQLEPSILHYLKSFSVLGITGPRQSGKSTLLRHLLPSYTYVTFDDPKIVDYFQEDPEGFITQYGHHIIFDEVQRVPKLFHYIKIAVDADRKKYGKFVLTGSSQFTLLQSISESLAGRIGLLSLLPFQYLEIPTKLRQKSIFSGGYPELVCRRYDDHQAWYSAYFDTYLNKDLRMISNIGDLRDFRRFIHLLAANTSQILNMSAYANDIGVSVTTIKRWISVLEASYIIFLLPPFYRNIGKRIVKHPKIYFYDTGMVSYFVGIENQTQYEKGPMAGSLFENYVVSEILKKEKHRNTYSELFYLRTSDQWEIDLIIDRKQTREFIEIKKTSSFKIRMLQSIQRFLEPKDTGYFLYSGKKFPLANRIQVINYQDYLAG